MMRVCRMAIIAALIGVALTGRVASAQEAFTEAQSLYANAQYEEALASLNRIRANGLSAHDVPPVEQYRALCLLALGRAAEAEEAIAAVVTAMPSYAPPDRDVSPRVRSAFQDVRRRVVPGVIQQRYAAAKAAFERREFEAAHDGFAQITKVLGDPGLADLASQPPLADLTLLAKGFLDLSANQIAAATSTAQAPPARASAPQPMSSVSARGLATNGDDVRPETPTASASARGSSGELQRDLANQPSPRLRRSAEASAEAVAASGREGGPVAPEIYSAVDSQVVPPVIVRQALPPYPRKPLIPQQGVVEVIINERGLVESAAMRQSVDAVYDALALAAARMWQYKPATREGVPVKYRKGVQIRIQP